MSKHVNISHGQQRSFQKFVNLVHSLPSSHVNQWNTNENSIHKDFCHGMTNCKIFKIEILTVQSTSPWRANEPDTRYLFRIS